MSKIPAFNTQTSTDKKFIEPEDRRVDGVGRSPPDPPYPIIQG